MADDLEPELPPNLRSIERSLKYIEKNAPPEGYLKVIKKRYFRPKTNWSMLAALIALASLIVMILTNPPF